MVNIRSIEHDYATLRKISFSIIGIVILIGIGTYLLYGETGNIKESVYVSTELITHIGIPQEASANAGLLFLLSVAGAILSVYIIIVLIDIFYTGKFKKSLEEAKILKKITKMKDHYVILGGGSLGESVAKSLKNKGKNVVVIEADNERVAELNHKGIPSLEGDCFDREYLETAGIGKAKMAITCLNDDGDNLLATMLVKEMNKNIKVIAEATFEKYGEQLKKVGADRVVVPRKISGSYMAEIAGGL